MMNLIDQLEVIELTISEASQAPTGQSTARLFTVYKHVLLYLVENDKLSLTSDSEDFWNYIQKYTPGALCRVASYHRKQHQQSPLNYIQEIFHIKENTMDEYRNKESIHL
ncbi:hypothetical protein [Salinicoccus roseus]|uniref:Uncharacterized protein n=1 Tax=Salinicoccus roseus TaxID=45670 RepID=A0A265E6C1_9STAP|nr:hypothetical protein [Salinicoccus roseus]OZT77141.1 hypothetical protein CFN03_08685 [Salinicoccus roseus]